MNGETIGLLIAFFLACWLLAAIFIHIGYQSWVLRNTKYGASSKSTALTIAPLAAMFIALPFIALLGELGFL